MLTYAPISGYGFGLAMSVDQARAALEEIRKALKNRAAQLNPGIDFADVFVYSANDPAGSGYILRLSDAEVSSLDIASTVLAQDIKAKTGIGVYQLMDVNAYPKMGASYKDMLAQIGGLLRAQKDATGASRFPIGATMGTIIGVSVIGGLVVWGMGKSGRSGAVKRRRRR